MPADPLTATFGALADPTYRAVLPPARPGRRHGQGVGRAVRNQRPGPFSRHPGASSNGERLITRGRDRQSRPRHLTPGPIKNVAAWAESYRDLWESSFDHLLDDLPALREWAQTHAGGEPGGWEGGCRRTRPRQ